MQNTLSCSTAITGSQSAFSVHLLIDSWNATLNASNKRSRLQPNDDFLISDGLLSCLDKILARSQTPVLTKYTITYTCPTCGTLHQNLENWDGKSWEVIPLLNIFTGTRVVTPAQLLTKMLSEEVRSVHILNQ